MKYYIVYIAGAGLHSLSFEWHWMNSRLFRFWTVFSSVLSKDQRYTVISAPAVLHTCVSSNRVDPVLSAWHCKNSQRDVKPRGFFRVKR
ncbi:hypothetical protein T4B_4651 [Trichinella pseudospiralis]|uniref:Uncharacterized protein n=2 Tax=Trichinella pseudospiralis TaxID=6337 RepID=A0A0V0XUW9_TRIPS|nr:hypothetical protein T4E_11054 [Trichinella pseudospiralis]KRY88862.1 hypothetical protein T4D_8584 [Trichinella pseudospiralis]KRZ31837.1 hypothetical protein T4B_4651 [Trichinella pseudospiralis]KRZ37782.1 hypothetical protein T4C_5360 [Trichinella pseudospiralis]